MIMRVAASAALSLALSALPPLNPALGSGGCDAGPVDPTCRCAVCTRWSRAYVRHLLMVGEPTAARLLTVHNLTWLLGPA